MEGLKNYYSEEEMEEIVKLAEETEAENEKLREELECLKSEQAEETQKLSSEKQELMSEISSMKSVMAEIGRQNQLKDEEIVSLNDRIGRYAGSDLELKESMRLKRLAEEKERSADEKLRIARNTFNSAAEKEERAKADKEEFDKHLETESRKIRAEEKKKYKRLLNHKEKEMDLRTAVIAAVLCAESAALLFYYDVLWEDLFQFIKAVWNLATGILF